MKKVMILAGLVLLGFSGMLFATAAQTATQCYVNDGATATVQVSNANASATAAIKTAVATDTTVPALQATETAIAGVATAAVANANASATAGCQLCDAIASYTATATITPTYTVTNTPNATWTQAAILTATATYIHGTLRKTATAIAANATATVVVATQTAIYLETAGTSAQNTATIGQTIANETSTIVAAYTPTFTPSPVSVNAAKVLAAKIDATGNTLLSVRYWYWAITHTTVAVDSNTTSYDAKAGLYWACANSQLSAFKKQTNYAQTIKYINLIAAPTPQYNYAYGYLTGVVDSFTYALNDAATNTGLAKVQGGTKYANKINSLSSYITAVLQWIFLY